MVWLVVGIVSNSYFRLKKCKPKFAWSTIIKLLQDDCSSCMNSMTVYTRTTYPHFISRLRKIKRNWISIQPPQSYFFSPFYWRNQILRRLEPPQKPLCTPHWIVHFLNFVYLPDNAFGCLAIFQQTLIAALSSSSSNADLTCWAYEFATSGCVSSARLDHGGRRYRISSHTPLHISLFYKSCS